MPLSPSNCSWRRTQLRLRNILDLVFPNYDKVFSHLKCVSSLKVIFHFPSPESVLSAPREDILAVLKASRRSASWSGDMKVDQLVLAARESLPANQAQQSNTRVLKNYIEILLSQQRILTDIRAQIIEQASLSPVFSPLLSISGVGELTAATILGEIGDISRFSTSKQVVAFAGLDPSVFESGKFKSTNN